MIAKSMLEGFFGEMEKIANPSWLTEAQARGGKKQKLPGPGDMAYYCEKKKSAGIMTNVGNKVVLTMKKGWQYGSNVPGKGWLGTGAQITPGMGRLGRGFEHVTSLGGATKYLPVGSKSLTVAGGLASLSEGLPKEDPQHKGRSRVERLSGSVLGTAAGIAASPLGLKAIPIGIGAEVAGRAIGRKLSPRKPVQAQSNKIPSPPNQMVEPPPRTTQ